MRICANRIIGRLAFAMFLLPVLAAGGHASPASASPSDTTAAAIQQLIQQAKDGEIVHVPAGSYQGRLLIDRPITLAADGDVTIRNQDEAPTVKITADGASLIGLHIVHEAPDKNAAVLVASDNVRIESQDIRTRAYGIMLRKANRASIKGNRIQWLDETATASKGEKKEKRNGIDLFEAHDNAISNNTVSNLNDGIYQESSDGNLVEGNAIDHSRYGVHCMFTKRTIVRDNSGYANVTGAMIMGVDDAVVTGNTFTKQSENVNSQGLLLFDVQTSKVEGNLVAGNRVGLYVEQSSANLIANNRVLQNFTGIQLLDSEDNQFTANDFIGNVIEAEATDSKNNKLEGNYWDAFRGIDSDGDGASNTRYNINPFFQQLTGETPAFQLFFRSPGMIFLESLFESNRDNWAFDAKPLMKPNFGDNASSAGTGRFGSLFAAGAALLLGSIGMIMKFGGRRR